MSVDHQHTSVRAGARHLRPLAYAFGLVVVFMVVEIVAGFVTGSLALLSDAGHMATDAVGLGMALAARPRRAPLTRSGCIGSRSSLRLLTPSCCSVLPAMSCMRP